MYLALIGPGRESPWGHHGADRGWSEVSTGACEH